VSPEFVIEPITVIVIGEATDLDFASPVAYKDLDFLWCVLDRLPAL
jgi:hypothetical protein